MGVKVPDVSRSGYLPAFDAQMSLQSLWHTTLVEVSTTVDLQVRNLFIITHCIESCAVCIENGQYAMYHSTSWP